MHIGHIGDWIKSHPWAAGIIVVVGGLAFILISGWFSNSSSAEPVYVGGTIAPPSDAAIAAGAQTQIAQINAGVATHVSDNNLAVQNLAATVQTTQATDALQLGLSNIASQLALGTAQNEAQRQVQLAGITAQQQVQTQSILSQADVAFHQLDEQGHEADLTAQTIQTQAAYGAQTTQASIAANQNIQASLISYLNRQGELDASTKQLEDQYSNAQWLYSQQNR